MTRLETFFAALRAQDTTRKEVEAFGDSALRQLVHRRRVAVYSSRVLPSGIKPNATLDELYCALEVQVADVWVNNEFPRAVAQMAFQALSHVREDIRSFPCARPSGVLIEGVLERIMGRYARSLWPNSTARPSDVVPILHQYILAMLRSNITREEVANIAIQALDGFLGLKDGDAEEARNHVQEDPREPAGLECTLRPEDDNKVDNKSCLRRFASCMDLASHLVEIHDFEQHQADGIAALCN